MKIEIGPADVRRRHHDQAFKDELVRQCFVPGASVSAIALAGGINANLLFRWRREHLVANRHSNSSMSSSTVLVPVRVAPSQDGDEVCSVPVSPPAAVTPTISAPRVACPGGVIELDIAGAQLRLRGPVDEASLCIVLRALREIS